MTTLAISAEGPNAWEGWRSAFAEAAPDLKTVSWFDPDFDPAKADYALVWNPAPGEMAKMRHMRAILCSGAGVNQLVHRPDFPKDVPLVRMGGDQTAELMSDYVLWAVISLLRDARTWALQQENRVFRRNLEYRTSAQTQVGILGFGNLGSAVARRLSQAGFGVSAWCRRERAVEDVALYFGEEGKVEMLGKTDILVNLLPSTPQTKGLIDAAFLSHLKPGAGIVNAGRGDQVVADDLLAALDAGRMLGAVLDVFEQEPLPETSLFWTHPKVFVTPHVAAEASFRMQAVYLADVIRQIEAGQTPALTYHPEWGY
ncbi:2-hydroxyacid dehydrogenase [Gluconobacter kanchanaburiensis]|uniref:Glyoxylate/hydroxypyruvate reductase A n=1 Tax=Gluconobacter kanchanaburiensis NBRC 103587 TaxID=1307948 RepID=A0A511BC05_9PROT|nr:glyoxylate/hydroxypyruvate reductase A [Gluconobacter kanchanaburiensis]MBF0861728.1 glyoxylate/hydroxypyruvate reductase A [Gluconobacter kanchanaburiensis]GBR67323.1 D-isomer specific 2-hydroxyacid dehydrogenase [Gluconobacter kanchanaburiensis NBRC 103587]GEK95377.1 glyoxylate/hydroxypyruvate reductase A [Gluconobacter kanchanaburiensis NBRC 103587]